MTPTRANRGRSPPRATRRGALPRRRRRRRTRGGSRPRGCARRRARDLARVARARRRLRHGGHLARHRGVHRRGGIGGAEVCAELARVLGVAALATSRLRVRAAVDVDVAARRRGRAEGRGQPRDRGWARGGVVRLLARLITRDDAACSGARARVDADRSDAGGDGARAEAPRARCARRAPARELPAPPRAPSRVAPPGHGDGILFSEESHRAASDFKVKVKRPEDQARARQLDSRRRVVERAAKGTWTRSSDADARADDRWDPSHRAPGSSRGKRAGHASDPPSRDVE